MAKGKHDFGIQIRRLRLKAGLTLSTLAKRLGISAAYAADVERGDRNPWESQLR